MHPIISAPCVNLWLGQGCSLDEKYVSKESFERATWTDICVGALISSGRVASAVVDQEVPVLARVVLVNGQEPDDFIHSQPVHNGHPWIAAGARGEDATKLRGLANTGATVYWLRNWDEPVPAEVDFPVTPIFGFDAESFFAAMLRGDFPPEPASRSIQFEDPLQDLERMFQEIKQHYRAEADAGYQELSTLLKQVDGAPDIDAILAKVRTAARRNAVILGRHHYSGVGVSCALAAEKLGGVKAEKLFRFADEMLSSDMDNHQYVRVRLIRRRARLHRSEVAAKFYSDADRIVRSLPTNRGIEWTNANEIARMYGDWAKASDAETATLMTEEAITILDRARQARLSSDSESSLWSTQCSLLGSLGLRYDGEDAAGHFEAARACARKIHEAHSRAANETRLKFFQSSDLSNHLLGIVSLEQARVTPPRHDELLEDARRHIEAFIERYPDREHDALQDWAVALALVARARQGAEAEAVMTQVFWLLERAAAKGDSPMFQDQWAGILLGYARTKSGNERENLLAEAARHARLAQAMDAQRTYNLACISAQRGVLEDVEKWLTCACEGAYCLPLENVLADLDFQALPQAWFQALVGRLFPC